MRVLIASKYSYYIQVFNNKVGSDPVSGVFY